jgi:hypothetical protein
VSPPRGKTRPVNLKNSTERALHRTCGHNGDWRRGDAAMRGRYYEYDGPGSPRNDARVHHYVFTLYALDVRHLEVQGNLSGENVTVALAGHVLAEASLIGTLTRVHANFRGQYAGRSRKNHRTSCALVDGGRSPFLQFDRLPNSRASAARMLGSGSEPA